MRVANIAQMPNDPAGVSGADQGSLVVTTSRVSSATTDSRKFSAHGIPASVVARRHPDNRTAWVIVMLARFEPGGTPPLGLVRERLSSAVTTSPLIGARLRNGWWMPEWGADVRLTDGGDPLAQAPLQPFILDQEPPLRVVMPTTRDWLLICAHHFAFDGLSMLSLLRALLTGEEAVAPDFARVSSPRRPPAEEIRRFFRPADRVAPSARVPLRESFAARQVQLPQKGVTAALARACAAAAVAHNAGRGQRLARIGLSIAVGGVDGEAATYRRLDLTPKEDIEAAVSHSLSDPRVPRELVGLPRGAFLLRPALRRLSDTLLVSNLGRVDLPGTTSVEFYPVARGRSAVAFGAAGLRDQPTTLTLRTLNLTSRDTTTLLERVVGELAPRQ